MTASSSVVLSNLAYLIGAVVLAVIGGLVVWLRHRKPTSIDANMASFNRGLRALAPERSDGFSGPRGSQPQPGGLGAIRPAAWVTASPAPEAGELEAGETAGLADPDEADPDEAVLDGADPAAEQAAGERAGAGPG